MKKCGHCQEIKLINMFGKNVLRKDGLNSLCKPCARASGKRIRLSKRYAVLRHYSKNETPYCSCCGEKRFEFLSIDHIGGGGKKHIISIGFNLARWLINNNFPKGYRVLCHNCNFCIGHYGYCAHKSKISLMDLSKDIFLNKRKGMRGEGHGNSKLSDKDVTAIRNAYSKNIIRSKIAKKFNVHWSTINRIVKRESRKAVQ